MLSISKINCKNTQISKENCPTNRIRFWRDKQANKKKTMIFIPTEIKIQWPGRLILGKGRVLDFDKFKEKGKRKQETLVKFENIKNS